MNLQTIINDLEQNADEMAVQAAITYLKSLQPSGNDDSLVHHLHNKRTEFALDLMQSDDGVKLDDQEVQEIIGLFDRAIATLSRPAPFDAIQHLRNQEPVADNDCNIYRLEPGSVRLMKLYAGVWCAADDEDIRWFLSKLFMSQLYEVTEPEPELEDGWYMCEVTLDNDTHERPLYKRGAGFFTFQTSKEEQFLKTKPLWRIEQPEV